MHIENKKIKLAKKVINLTNTKIVFKSSKRTYWKQNKKEKKSSQETIPTSENFVTKKKKKKRLGLIGLNC